MDALSFSSHRDGTDEGDVPGGLGLMKEIYQVEKAKAMREFGLLDAEQPLLRCEVEVGLGLHFTEQMSELLSRFRFCETKMG